MSTSYRLVTTRVEFEEALREAFTEIQKIGCREIFLCDADYAAWPLDEAVVLQSLTRWALPHRKLTMLARDFDIVPRRFPKFTEWRRTWSHIMDCRILDEADAAQPPVLLLAPGVVTVRIVEPLQMRGSFSRETADQLLNRELIDAVSQRSTPGFPAHVLGL